MRLIRWSHCSMRSLDLTRCCSMRSIRWSHCSMRSIRQSVPIHSPRSNLPPHLFLPDCSHHPNRLHSVFLRDWRACLPRLNHPIFPDRSLRRGFLLSSYFRLRSGSARHYRPGISWILLDFVRFVLQTCCSGSRGAPGVRRRMLLVIKTGSTRTLLSRVSPSSPKR